jgi:hypothetical protein
MGKVAIDAESNVKLLVEEKKASGNLLLFKAAGKHIPPYPCGWVPKRTVEITLFRES